ncbi:MAG: stage II sporulation protein D [Acholeplasma sp.]|jgi:stage II sporulation protein D|nr:stage II sporulation protein D [Acholeplasma sp.]CCY28959.1 stage II sporulation protein D [Acholeplasma sp. CAG:878]
MKKILFFVVLIVIVPFIVVNLFVKEEEIKFNYTNNLNVRVKRDTGIVTVPLEDYVVGVLAGEMPIEFEMEALKAQAVAARSYVLKKMSYNKEKEYDVVDTIMNQVYLDNDYLKKTWGKDYVKKINKLKTAVIETNYQYVDYNGNIADTMFFSTSVGETENSEEVFSNKVPYLKSVSSTWDEISPVYKLNYQFKLNEFLNKLDLPYSNFVKLEVIDSTSTGRVKKIKINEKTFDGSVVVTKLKLKSNHFTIKQDGDTINITTKGYGHGVGMSQYGAQGMALNGYSYEEILMHYYQGTSIKKI